jgi:hypothetical protein
MKINKKQVFTGKEGVDWEKLQEDGEYDKLNYQQKRWLNYPEMSDKDIGHLYDMLSTIIEQLAENGINITLDSDEQKVLDFRNLIKERIPKE